MIPDERPSFEDVHEILRNYLEDLAGDCGYLDVVKNPKVTIGRSISFSYSMSKIHHR